MLLLCYDTIIKLLLDSFRLEIISLGSPDVYPFEVKFCTKILFQVEESISNRIRLRRRKKSVTNLNELA